MVGFTNDDEFDDEPGGAARETSPITSDFVTESFEVAISADAYGGAASSCASGVVDSDVDTATTSVFRHFLTLEAELGRMVVTMDLYNEAAVVLHVWAITDPATRCLGRKDRPLTVVES